MNNQIDCVLLLHFLLRHKRTEVIEDQSECYLTVLTLLNYSLLIYVYTDVVTN